MAESSDIYMQMERQCFSFACFYMWDEAYATGHIPFWKHETSK